MLISMVLNWLYLLYLLLLFKTLTWGSSVPYRTVYTGHAMYTMYNVYHAMLIYNMLMCEYRVLVPGYPGTLCTTYRTGTVPVRYTTVRVE